MRLITKNTLHGSCFPGSSRPRSAFSLPPKPDQVPLAQPDGEGKRRADNDGVVDSAKRVPVLHISITHMLRKRMLVGDQSTPETPWVKITPCLIDPTYQAPYCSANFLRSPSTKRPLNRDIGIFCRFTHTTNEMHSNAFSLSSRPSQDWPIG